MGADSNGDEGTCLRELGCHLRSLGYGESVTELARVLGVDLGGAQVLPIWG